MNHIETIREALEEAISIDKRDNHADPSLYTHQLEKALAALSALETERGEVVKPISFGAMPYNEALDTWDFSSELESVDCDRALVEGWQWRRVAIVPDIPLYRAPSQPQDTSYESVEYSIAMDRLDAIGVPRADDGGNVYSILGRINRLYEQAMRAESGLETIQMRHGITEDSSPSQPQDAGELIEWIKLSGEQGEPAGTMTVTVRLKNGKEVEAIKTGFNSIYHSVNVAHVLNEAAKFTTNTNTDNG